MQSTLTVCISHQGRAHHQINIDQVALSAKGEKKDREQTEAKKFSRSKAMIDAAHTTGIGVRDWLREEKTDRDLIIRHSNSLAHVCSVYTIARAVSLLRLSCFSSEHKRKVSIIGIPINHSPLENENEREENTFDVGT